MYELHFWKSVQNWWNRKTNSILTQSIPFLLLTHLLFIYKITICHVNWKFKLKKNGKSFSRNGFTVCTNEKQVFCGYVVKANMLALERPFKKRMQEQRRQLAADCLSFAKSNFKFRFNLSCWHFPLQDRFTTCLVLDYYDVQSVWQNSVLFPVAYTTIVPR